MYLGRIKGIRIKLNYSTILIVILVGFSAVSFYMELLAKEGIQTSLPPYSIISFGLLAGVILLLSILAHELMHSITALHYKIPISEIELYMFGGVAKMQGEPHHPKHEMLIAIMGPLTSLSIGASSYLIVYLLALTSANAPISVVALLLYTGQMNFVLGLFNLLPAFPMDGGRVLRALLWKKKNNFLEGTRVAVKVSQFFASMFFIIGFLELFMVSTISGLWLIFLGNFLRNAANSEYSGALLMEKLNGLSLHYMIERPNPVAINLPLYYAITKMLYEHRTYLPVIYNNKIVGILHIDTVSKIAPHLREKLTVWHAMVPIEKIPAVTIETPLRDVARALTLSPLGIVRVTDSTGKELLGFTTVDVLQLALRYSGL